MTATTMTLEEKVARRVYLAEQIARLEDEKKMIDADLLENYETGNHDAGDWTLQIKAGAKRLNAERFMARYAPDAYPHFYRPTPDLAVVKEFFSPIELEQFQDSNRASVAVK